MGTLDKYRKVIIYFGKYKYESVVDVLIKDEQYLKWIYENVERNDFNKKLFEFLDIIFE